MIHLKCNEMNVQALRWLFSAWICLDLLPEPSLNGASGDICRLAINQTKIKCFNIFHVLVIRYSTLVFHSTKGLPLLFKKKRKKYLGGWVGAAPCGPPVATGLDM